MSDSLWNSTSQEPALDDEEMWVPGFENSDEPIAIGDLIIENITFSADDGSGRTSKRRPCVVIGITDSEVRLLPIHSTERGLNRVLGTWNAGKS